MPGGFVLVAKEEARRVFAHAEHSASLKARTTVHASFGACERPARQPLGGVLDLWDRSGEYGAGTVYLQSCPGQDSTVYKRYYGPNIANLSEIYTGGIRPM